MINPLAALSFWLFASLFAMVFVWKRWRFCRNKALGKRRLGFYPNAAALGNALQILQTLAQPHVEHIVEEKLAEPAEDEDSGGPDDPTAHLLRQAQHIREGKPPKRLTALLPQSSKQNPRSHSTE